MKKKLLSLMILALPVCAGAQTSTITGKVFLENQTDHRNVRVLFERTAPSALTDSAFSDSAGNFSKVIPTGIYTVSASKTGYIGTSVANVNCYSNNSLADTTMLAVGLSGSLSGTLTAGNYRVSGDIYVTQGDSLTISPGVRLEFMPNVFFTVHGTLKALGTVSDSIYFTSETSGQMWGGLTFSSTSNNSILKYAVVELSMHGGISIYGGNPSITYSTIRFNTRLEPGNKIGAGILVGSGSPTLDYLLINNNKVFGSGAGIAAVGVGDLTINHSVFSGNSLDTNISWPGGAIYFSRKSNNLHILNSVFVGNSGGECRANAIYASTKKEIEINNVLIANNASEAPAQNSYTAIELETYSGDPYSARIINTTIASNKNCHALIAYGNGTPSNCSLRLTNCNVTSNTLGWGIYLYNTVGVDLSMRNCNIWGNLPGMIGHKPPVLMDRVTVNSNGDSCDAWGNISFDPQLHPETWMLSPGSKCIDAGLNDSVTVSTDLAGKPRIFDGDQDGDTIVDIGAFEFDSASTTTGFRRMARNETDFLVYPNPAQHNITVEVPVSAGSCTFDVISVTGKVMITAATIAKRQQFDTTGWSRGLYFIRMAGNQTSCTRKLLLN